jgi:hypothetical protein
MKKTLSIFFVFISLLTRAQTLYIPSNPDSLKMAVTISGGPRSVYVIDLVKNKVDSLSSVNGVLYQHKKGVMKAIATFAPYAWTSPTNEQMLAYRNGVVVNRHWADSIQVSDTVPSHGNIYARSGDTSINIRMGGVWWKFKQNGVGGSTPAAGSPEDLTFSPVVNLSNSGSNVWVGSTAIDYYQNYGLATKYLPANTDGYIQFQYKSADGYRAMLAFNTTNANQSFNTNPGNPGAGTGTYEAAAAVNLYGGPGALTVHDNGADMGNVTSQSTIQNNDYIRVIRTGSVLKAQRSTDQVVWIDLYTYNFSSTAALYINAAVWNGKLYYPKGFNLQTRP